VWTDFAFAETIHLFREKADRRVAVRAFHRGHAPCGLTPELSGGGAVRLDDWLGRMARKLHEEERETR